MDVAPALPHLGAMPPAPHVPEALTHGPFTVDDALRAGLSRRQLQSACWQRVSSGLYVWAEIAQDPLCVLEALHRRLPTGAVFSDRTAGWLHGLDLEPCQPAQATVPPGRSLSARAEVSVRRGALPAADVVECGGLPATAPVRTLFDLARRLPLTDALVAVDMALHRAVVGLDGLRTYVAAHGTAHGVAQARRVVELAEPLAESPMETRLRLLLVEAGLPRPAAQVALTDERGSFVGRVDLYYPGQRLAVEYDGGAHRGSLAADNRRQNRLLAAGYRLVRFTAGDVYDSPDALIDQVRAALGRGKVEVSTPARLRSA